MSAARHFDLPAVVGRARACLLGLALGDALGATTEFMTPQEIRARFGVHRKLVGGGWLGLRPGQVTDDTEMSLCVARAVAARSGWNLEAVADAFSAWLRGRPTDVGDTCRRGIRAYMLHGRTEAPPGRWDAGNGAAMRMAPVALLTLGDDALLVRLALAQAHLTHNHPLSDAACVAVGRLIHRAMCGEGLPGLTCVARELAAAHPELDYRAYDGKAGGYVAETLRTVLHFLHATGSFHDCLVGVVNQGGDADTTGAIAGAVAGALYGLESLPRPWLGRLDPAVRAELWALAEPLVRLSPLGRHLP
ncbi:MAG: ADP-ribosyl-[dinitrogen reductase] hydrolase [Thermodesulfobacteriota bacterium]